MAPIAKRRKPEPVDEISFDPASREQYLTGFHKRKQLRIKHAQETAAKHEREQRIQQRKDVRPVVRLYYEE
jgi:ribosomal RNA-processing protein 17